MSSSIRNHFLFVTVFFLWAFFLSSERYKYAKIKLYEHLPGRYRRVN